jgi:hypothetical protein
MRKLDEIIKVAMKDARDGKDIYSNSDEAIARLAGCDPEKTVRTKEGVLIFHPPTSDVIRSIQNNPNMTREEFNALYDILQKENDSKKVYTLFETHLINSEVKDHHNRVLRNSKDILVGFIADSDASFEIVITNNLDDFYDNKTSLYTVFPVTMKKGDFQLAWRDKNVIPSIKIVYSNLIIRNLVGNVRMIGTHLDSIYRRELAINRFILDDDGWIADVGMLGQNTSSNAE